MDVNVGIRSFSSKKWELWWQCHEKWFNIELEKAINAFEILFAKSPEVICFSEDTVHLYEGPLEVRTRVNIPSKQTFVLCGKDKQNGTSSSFSERSG